VKVLEVETYVYLTLRDHAMLGPRGVDCWKMSWTGLAPAGPSGKCSD